MPLRLLEVYHSYDEKKNIKELLKNVPVIGIWDEKHEKQILTKILLPTEETEDVLNILERNFSKDRSFRIIIIPAEASIPRVEEKEEKKEKERMSVEEIYQDLTESAKVSKTYVTLVILASIVASIGILYNDVAVIIGSMVIAPLLSPNMALALSTTLADSKLARHALVASLIGYSIAFFIGIIFGILFKNHFFKPRINLSLLYILLALSAGIAGSLSITKGVIQALVGVMVAVALLPPIVTSGLLLGQGNLLSSIGSFFLFSINVVSINLACVLTFIIQGISPRTWWKKKKAKKTIWLSIAIWLSILFALIILIYFYEKI